MKKTISFAMAGSLCLLTGALTAQTREKQLETFQVAVPPPPDGGDVLFFNNKEGVRHQATFEFVRAEMAFGGKPVKGAPYTAESVTENTQVLADGNRITRKSAASMARDGEGRTRREQSLPAIGPWASSGDAPLMIFIDDPVAGTHYVLNSKEKTARKVAARVPGDREMVQFRTANAARVGGSAGVAVAGIPAIPGPGPAVGMSFERVMANGKNSKEENLGEQLIEGVKAQGKRTTITIPAGEIGNDLPIDIVSEIWYSPELQTTVLSKHRDPRMGETVNRLTGIQRSEPSRSLFEVPSDYSIVEDSPIVTPFHRKIETK